MCRALFDFSTNSSKVPEMTDRTFFVYILASTKGVIYTGMTRDLSIRIDQHRSKAVSGFGNKYNATKLVWCELADDFEAARQREKEIKGWRRSKKVALIERNNPYWEDIADSIL